MRIEHNNVFCPGCGDLLFSASAQEPDEIDGKACPNGCGWFDIQTAQNLGANGEQSIKDDALYIRWGVASY